MTRAGRYIFFQPISTYLVSIIACITLTNCIQGTIISAPKPKKNDSIARAEATEKKYLEQLLGAESGFGCPSGFKFSTLYRFCTNGTHVQGSFPAQMISNCKAESPSSTSCNDLLWPVELAKRIRGTDQCPPGTGLDEILGVCAFDDYVFGPFPLDLIQLCSSNTANVETCQSMRWDRKTISGVVQNNKPTLTPGPSNNFAIAAPTASDKGKNLSLWATQYYLETAEDIANGVPLRAINGSALGPKLARKKWCSAAMEGSVKIISGNLSGKTFNYAGKTDEYIVDCSEYFDHAPSGRVKFQYARGDYGDGVMTYILVPYRTIAVDPKFIAFGSVLYIPQARGVAVEQPDGSTVQHDGYFFAGDTGGLIKNNHIDVFTGANKKNPFAFIKSKDSSTFEAWLITNPSIVLKVRLLHSKK